MVEVRRHESGRVAERLMATDCKSVAPCELRRFESSPVHQIRRARGAIVERAVVAQLVERVLGKDEVTSSILVNGSSISRSESAQKANSKWQRKNSIAASRT